MRRELYSILCNDLLYSKVYQLYIYICPLFFRFYSHIVFAFVNSPDPKRKFHESRGLPLLLIVIF